MNSLEKENLSNREMKAVKGGIGRNCFCGCLYTDQNGISIDANCDANYLVGDGGYATPGYDSSNSPCYIINTGTI